MATQLEDMDIGSLMPVIRGGGGSSTVSTLGNKEGHWVTENSYEIPGGKVDNVQETTLQSGKGWHTSGTKQTTMITQDLSGADVNMSGDASGGAVTQFNPSQNKLLSELDSLANLLGTDLDKAKISQTAVTTTTSSKTVKLSKISSAFHGQPFDQAVKSGYLDLKSGTYTDFSGKKFILYEAFEKDLINPDSAVFLNPITHQQSTLFSAMQKGLVDKNGTYRDPSSKAHSLEACMANSTMVTREVEPILTETSSERENLKIHIDKVLDPSTNQMISVEEAIQRGIFDPAKGKYFNIKSGELLSIQEAVAKGLMLTAAQAPESSQASSAQLIKTSKSFNVVGAIHPVLKKRMSLNEAIAEGILEIDRVDRSKGLYLDTLNNKRYKIQEAIQKGLVIAEEASNQRANQNMEVVTSNEETYTVTGVLHPTTGETLGVQKATDMGILDRAAGVYRNIETGDTISLKDAIDKGLVLVQRGVISRDDRDRKVSSLHIDEEEEEVWTVVEEVKTETKKWVITSVVDPRTNTKISFDDALLEGILDQQNGKYCNPETGEELNIATAIEKNLILGELVSVNMDEEEYSSFQISSDNIEHVRDPRTHKIITYDAACKLGLIDSSSKTFHNPVTGLNMNFEQAAEKGYIKKKSKSPTSAVKETETKQQYSNPVEASRGTLQNKRNVFEEAMKGSSTTQAQYEPFGHFDESMRVEETKTMQTDYIESNYNTRPIIQSSTPNKTGQSSSQVDSVLDRAKMYTDSSAISSTEHGLHGYTTDWDRELVYNLRSGEEMSLDNAVERGILDSRQVNLMRNYKTARTRSQSPNKAATQTTVRSQQSNVHHSPPTSHFSKTQEAHQTNGNMSMTVKVDQVQTSQSRIGALPYEAAVRLGLFSIKTGRFCEPVSGLVLGIQDSVSQGFIQANGTAIKNLNTGSRITLGDCIQRALIDSDSGKLYESKLKQLNIAVPNQFMASKLVKNQPINFEDAIKVGLLNPFSGEFTHPQSDETSSLGDAVYQNLIAGKSVVLQDPTSGNRFYLDEALKRRILHPTTGDIMNTENGEKVMSLYDSLRTKLYESVYDPYDSTLLDPNTGQRVDCNQAVKRSLLGHNTCLVYDTEKGRQISFDEAINEDIIDRQTAMYTDRKGGRKLVCKTAAEMGLIEPVGAPVLSKIRTMDSINKLYSSATDSISAPSYTMYEDVSSKQVAAVRKPEIRTEIDTQEYQTERTIKLSSGADKKIKQIEMEPGDKVLVPKAYRSAPTQPLAPQRPTPPKIREPEQIPVVEQPLRNPENVLDSMRSHAELYYNGETMTKKDTLKSPLAPVGPAQPLPSPGGATVISITEEKFETVEKKQGHRKPRVQIDDISAPEFFVKGEELLIVESDEDIDNFKINLHAPKPDEIDWDLSLVQRPGAEQKVTKVVEEVVEEMLDNSQNQQKALPQPQPQTDMNISVETYEREVTPEPEPVVEPEVIEPVRRKPVEKPKEPEPEPERIRDREIIIIEKEGGNITRNYNITIDTALDEGYIDLSRREFTHPVTNERMSLIKAIRRGYIQGSNEDIKRAITNHYEKISRSNRAIMEYSTKQEFSSVVEREHSGMSLAEAISDKLFDTKTGKFTEPTTGLTYSLKEAVDEKLIDGESAQFTSPGNKKVYSLQDALNKKVMDHYGKWTSPLTGSRQPFSEAIRKGHVKMISSEQTINKMTTITEVKKVGVDYVMNPLTREKIDYNTAVMQGIISPVEGIYRNPATGDTLTLDEAFKYGLISGEVLDTKRKTEEKILDSTNIVSQTLNDEDETDGYVESHESNLHIIRAPTRSYVIDTVVDPRTNKLISAGEAIKLGIINASTATYTNIVTMEQITFEEAIKRGLLRCMETTQLPDDEKFNILGVICPRTGNEISLSQAIDDGIIDFSRGIYINIITSKTLTFAEAIKKGLIRYEGNLPSEMSSVVNTDNEETVTNSTYTESKSYTITNVKDTTTGELVGIKEAIRRGLLESDLSFYKDVTTGKTYTIQEAIDEGFLIATQDDPNKPKTDTTDSSTHVQTTQVFDIESVIDPKTQEEVSLKEAVAKGIIDEATGDYVNVDTMESWSMDSAIKQGVIKAKPIPAHDTVSFSICGVIDPKTGEAMTVSDALRHGFLDRGRRHFCNAHTGEVFTLDEAQQKGWIQTKSNYDRSRANTGFNYASHHTKLNVGNQGPSGFRSFTILSVTDPKTGEDLTVAQAIQRGILDNSRRNYRDSLTGETMTLDSAVKRSFIKLAPSSVGVTKTTFSEALRRGYINPQTGKYACPSTGQVLSVDEAVRRGLLVDETGHRMGEENDTIKPQNTTKYTRSFETALRSGLIDRRSGKFMDPESGEAMTLGRAVHQGHLTPKTQWRAYSIRQQTIPSQGTLPRHHQDGPPSPESVVSAASYKPGDPIYSTIHKTRQARLSSHREPPVGSINIYAAKQRGLVNEMTGEVTIPQYGTSMLIDDAIIQGLITTKVPINILLARPAGPNSMPVHQAFQKGLVNPANFTVRNQSGAFISIEDALASGYLYPQASSTMNFGAHTTPAMQGQDELDSRQMRSTSMPPAQAAYQYHHKTHSSQRNMGNNQTLPRMDGSMSMNGIMNGHSHLKPGVGTLPMNGGEKSWRVQQSTSAHSVKDARSPLLNGNAHFVNGKLYACRQGFQMNPSGQVVNLNTGETISLQQAIQANIAQLIPDSDEHELITPQTTFNRDLFFPAQQQLVPFDDPNTGGAISTLNQPTPVDLASTASFNPASKPVQRKFYAKSSEQYYSEINR